MNQSRPAVSPESWTEQDVRVVEPGGEPDLPDEPLGAQRVRQLGMEDLQGDGAVVPEIAGEIDRGHAATAELALEHVAVGQGGLEPFEGLGQRDLSDWDTPKPIATSRQRARATATATVSATVSPGRSGHFGAGKRAPMLGK